MATTRYPVTDAAWADLGTTPCFMQLVDVGPVHFVIDTAAPSSADLAAAHVLGGRHAEGHGVRETSTDIGLAGQRVYARTAPGRAASVVVSR